MNYFRPSTSSSSPPHTNTHSAGSSILSSDSKRQILRRKDFQYKHGHKVHSHDSEKAPYPLAYDRSVIELESLDNKLCQYIRGSVSFVSFDDGPPKRTLDLGCGTGTWVIDAAKEWPNCELVGFDLVDIQISLKFLDPSIADRIQWKHGNFLTSRLPFEDDEFDHVHVQSIARGVPENKWGVLFDEISRVLQPGGSVEVIEDDIIFPTLPRWFTQALRARPLRDTAFHRSQESRSGFQPKLSSLSDTLSHDHALLESLHTAIYESRFINMTPSSVLPSYLTTYFRQVNVGPVLNFPMPPLAPIRSLPPQLGNSYTEPSIDLDSRRMSSSSPSPPGTRPVSLSFSAFSALANSSSSSEPRTSTSQRPRTSSEPLANGIDRASSVTPTPPSSKVSGEIDMSLPLPSRYLLDEEGTSSDIGLKPLPSTLMQRQKVASLSERSLAMQLYRSCTAVIACQESMWEELKDRIRNRRQELIPFGWDDDEELEELQSRKKFERLIERYRTDMLARIALWSSLEDIGWSIPPREALSKAELVEEERLRDSMIEARKQATMEEMTTTCRAVRAAIGRKP